jgi:hypothetical protein
MSLYEKQKQALELQRSALENQLLQIELEQKIEQEHRKNMTGLDKNMAIMSDWLHKTKDLKDYYECEDKGAHYYSGGLCPYGNADDGSHGRWEQGLDKLKDTHVSQTICFNPPGRQVPPSPRVHVRGAKCSQVIRKFGSGGGNRMYNDDLPPPEVPSEFMINFVEGTFNIFTQLTDRIKVLEDKLDSTVWADYSNRRTMMKILVKTQTSSS